MKKKVRYDRVIIAVVLLLIFVFIVYKVVEGAFSFESGETNEEVKMINLVNSPLADANFFAYQSELEVIINYEYSDTIQKDNIISQSINVGTILEKGQSLEIVVSLGKLDKEELKMDGINELGKIPVMMYHGIVNTPSDSTNYTGGNVDKDGYNRTAEAFREDLEYYYEEGYRMIRLIDYVNGNIETEYGKSPIVLTFDDGNANNLKVEGLDEEGNIIIDPDSAVGILESFKEKYPDFNVTATFFVNDELFNQSEYNEEILKWLVENGYDVGNHTKTHVDFKNATTDRTIEEVGYIYQKLERIIPGKYVNIVALPFGSPYNKTHANFSYILNGTYEDSEYETVATLRVGWEAELSPFNKDFDKTFLKRIRAWDNNGDDDMKFRINQIVKTRYVSDGNAKTIIIPSTSETNLIETTLDVITY